MTETAAPARGAWVWSDQENLENAGLAHHTAGQEDPNLEISLWHGYHDGKPVIQIDTHGDVDFRINVNDAPIWDQSAEESSVADIIKHALADGENDAMFEAVCEIAALYEIEIPEEL